MKNCILLLRRTAQLVFVGLILASQSALSQTNRTIFPPGLENQPGNSGDATFSGGVPEYQELFRASTLANTWQGPVKITGVSFRVAENSSSSFDAVVPRVELRFSTSARPPELMSRFYSENRGADETTVFLHDNVRIFATGTQAVNPFEVRFQFDTPFIYDPANGHLLMYLTHDGPTLPSEQGLDAQLFAQLNSSPFASFGGGGFGAPTAYGLVTQFEWAAIPEPSSVELLGLATIVFCSSLLIKRKS